MEAILRQPDAGPPPANRAWAFFLDIDGTLVDIAPTPSTIRVGTELPGLLRRLHEATGGAVALISGRSLADVDRILPGLALPGAGQHGLELRDGRGAISCSGERTADHENVLARLGQFVAAHRALELEDKGQSFAIHYRAAPQLEELVRKAARAAQMQLGPRYAVRRGKRVVEVGPEGTNKGQAIDALLETRPFSGRLPVFVGDDLTDEDGFAAVNARGGHSVKIGAGPSCARWRLLSPNAVARWLEAALRAHDIRSA